MNHLHLRVSFVVLILLAWLGQSIQGARDGAFIGYSEKNDEGGKSQITEDYTHIVMTTKYGKVRL